MGWRNRDWLFGIDPSLVFDRAGNIGPTLWWNGEVIGSWALAPNGDVRTTVVADRGAQARAAIEHAGSQLHARLDGAAVTPAIRTPLEQHPGRRQLIDQTVRQAQLLRRTPSAGVRPSSRFRLVAAGALSTRLPQTDRKQHSQASADVANRASARDRRRRERKRRGIWRSPGCRADPKPAQTWRCPCRRARRCPCSSGSAPSRSRLRWRRSARQLRRPTDDETAR